MIGVTDLNLAISNYRKLGFRVEKGGIHSGGVSHNALIFLGDDTFLELFAFRPSSKTSMLRILSRLGGRARWRKKASKGHLARFTRNLFGREGLMDVCVKTLDLHKTVRRIREQQINISQPKEFYRLRPDQIRMGWQLAFPKVLTLPFIIGPVMPNILKEPEDFEHTNGAVAIKGLTIAVRDMESHIQMYRKLLETDPQIGRDGQNAIATFEIGRHQLQLLEVADQQQEGLTEVTLYTVNGVEEKIDWKDELLHHANIRLLPKY